MGRGDEVVLPPGSVPRLVVPTLGKRPSPFHPFQVKETQHDVGRYIQVGTVGCTYLP